jgi:hypothetical protein
MRLDSGSIQTVSSVGLRDVPDTAVHPAVGACFAGDSNQLLQDVLRLSQDWVAQLRVPDLQREAILHLGNLAEELLRNGNASPLAMTQLRALLCGNCRHLNAVQNQCAGRSLHRCQLLTKPGHGGP